MTAGERWLVVGGAGFLGSHFVDRLLGSGGAAGVTVYDNFSSGREWHLEQHGDDDRLVVQRADVDDLETLHDVMRGHDAVIHLASNPDIARAAIEPTIDFDQGTVLTQNVVEAMRVTETPRILYASGSGVYGDLGETAIDEDWGPLVPISTYGASKLAGETLISAYAAMFGLRGRAFRFGNVVGPRQTHGVGFDFVRTPPRRPDSTAHPRRRIAEQVVHPRARTSSTPCCWRMAQARTPTTSTTSRPGTTSPSPRSRTSPPKASG